MRVNYVNEYRTNGYAVIKNVFSQKEVSAIRAAAIIATSQVSELPTKGYKHMPIDIRVDSDGYSYPAISFWPSLLSPFLEKVRIDKRLQEIVISVLGPNTKQLNNQFYFHLSGEDDAFDWHQDIMFRHPLDDYPRMVEEDNYLQTAIIIDSFIEEISPLYMVPESYRLGDLRLLQNEDGTPNYSNLRKAPNLDFPLDRFGLKPMVLKADPGDVAIWCSLTLHASCPGTQTGHRAYFMNGFAASHNARGWPIYTEDGQIRELDPSQIP